MHAITIELDTGNTDDLHGVYDAVAAMLELQSAQYAITVDVVES